VDWHPFYIDPDPTFHFDANLDPDPNLTLSLQMLENNKDFIDFYSQQCQLNHFYLSGQRP
jgi:hypothetical protein